MKSNRVRHGVRATNPETLPSVRPSATVRFDAKLVVNGICFHVIDEHLATSVTEESTRRATARLTRERLDLALPREHWEAMDHRERLNWLMTSSHTVMSLAAGGVAVLHHDDEADDETP